MNANGFDPRASVRAVNINPVRVLVIDPEAVSRLALGRAVDLDRALAVVGLCGDLRRAVAEMARCTPDVVAVRLAIDDLRAIDLLAELASAPNQPCVVLLGAPGAAAMAGRDADRLVERIKLVVRNARPADPAVAVAEPLAAAMPAGAPAGVRLH